MSKRQLPHQLAGYDRTTEDLAVEYDLDAKTFKKIEKFVPADHDDPEIVGCYPLNNRQLREISDIIGLLLNNDKCEFFLEPA